MEMSDSAVQGFIRRAMVARIATLSKTGRPSITPLYFVLMGDHIWLGTADWTLAAREVAANPRVSVLFQLERSSEERRVLRLTGDAVVRTDPATMRASNLRMALKYVLPPAAIIHQLAHANLAGVRRQYYAQSKSKGRPCVLDLTPAHAEFLTP